MDSTSLEDGVSDKSRGAWRDELTRFEIAGVEGALSEYFVNHPEAAEVVTSTIAQWWVGLLMNLRRRGPGTLHR